MAARNTKLRAVAPAKKPPLLAIDDARAERVYPKRPSLAEKWKAATTWMQSRPGGSIWLMDVGSSAKWRGLPVEGERA